MRSVATVGLAAFAVAVTLSGCSGTATKRCRRRRRPPRPSLVPAAAHNQQDDVMFAHHMIPHHQQGDRDERHAPGKQGIDPWVVDLAKQIKAAQGPRSSRCRAG